LSRGEGEEIWKRPKNGKRKSKAHKSEKSVKKKDPTMKPCAVYFKVPGVGKKISVSRLNIEKKGGNQAGGVL